MAAPETPRSASAWEIIELSHNSWRICDAALTEADASRLVAYVDQNETGHVDVLWLRSPCPARSRYRNLDELLADLDAADAALAAERNSRSTRPTQIPHFPPSHRPLGT